jgi:hypothetical protein
MQFAALIDHLAPISQDLGVLLGAMIGGLVVGSFPPIIGAVRRWWGSKKTQDTDIDGYFVGFPPNSDFLSISSKVYDRIGHAREQFGADRLSISLCHNGGRWLDDTPVKKISMAYETVEGDRPRRQHLHQNELVTMYADALWMFEKQEEEIHEVAKMKDSYFRSIRVSLGITHVAILPLISHGRIRGYIILEWKSSGCVLSTPADQEAFFSVFKNLRDSLTIDMGWGIEDNHGK